MIQNEIMPSNKNMSGQAMLMLIILLMLAALVLGGSIVARTLLSSRFNVYNLQNESAVTMADSGIEIATKSISEAISNNQPVNTGDFSGTINLSNYTYNIKAEGGSGGTLVLPDFSLAKNQIEVFVLDKKVNMFSLTWYYSDTSPVPMEINFLRKEAGGEYTLVQKSYYCPDQSGSPDFTGLITPTPPTGGVNTTNKNCNITENVGTSGKEYDIIQIVPRQNSTWRVRASMTALGGQVVPLQGYTITSTGVSGESRRTVKILYMLPNLARIFNSTLYAKSVQNN